MINLEENNAKTHVGWSFYDDIMEFPSIEDLKDGIAKPPVEILQDIKNVLRILNDAELLYPKYFVSDKKNVIHSTSIDDFCTQMWKIVSQQNGLLSIDKIGGVGNVSVDNNEFAQVDDLVTLEDVRFCNRQFQIKTSFSFWLPLTMNPYLPPIWQPQIAILNAPRLQNAIQKIHETSQMDIEPELNEIDKEQLIWIKNYQLFVSPKVLQDALEEVQPKPTFDLQPFKIE